MFCDTYSCDFELYNFKNQPIKKLKKNAKKKL